MSKGLRGWAVRRHLSKRQENPYKIVLCWSDKLECEQVSSRADQKISLQVPSVSRCYKIYIDWSKWKEKAEFTIT